MVRLQCPHWAPPPPPPPPPPRDCHRRLSTPSPPVPSGPPLCSGLRPLREWPRVRSSRLYGVMRASGSGAPLCFGWPHSAHPRSGSFVALGLRRPVGTGPGPGVTDSRSQAPRPPPPSRAHAPPGFHALQPFLEGRVPSGAPSATLCRPTAVATPSHTSARESRWSVAEGPRLLQRFPPNSKEGVRERRAFRVRV